MTASSETKYYMQSVRVHCAVHSNKYVCECVSCAYLKCVRRIQVIDNDETERNALTKEQQTLNRCVIL